MAAVLIKNRTASMNVDMYNRSAVGTTDLDNGKVFHLNAQSTASGSAECWTAVATAGSSLGIWMAASPESVLTSSKYRGIDPDPRNFTNVSGLAFDAFKPVVGDIITMTAAGISGSPSTGAFVISGSQAYTLVWNAAAPGSGSVLAFRLIAETYISFGTGAIDTQRVLAYKLECIYN